MQNSKTKYGLTKKQQDAYDFIVSHIDSHGEAPSYDQIMAGLNLKSKSNVHRLVYGLLDRGWIDLIPNRARTIIIL